MRVPVTQGSQERMPASVVMRCFQSTSGSVSGLIECSKGCW
jgi:hypothetical protein